MPLLRSRRAVWAISARRSSTGVNHRALAAWAEHRPIIVGKADGREHLVRLVVAYAEDTLQVQRVGGGKEALSHI